jgi:hypothetical protein
MGGITPVDDTDLPNPKARRRMHARRNLENWKEKLGIDGTFPGFCGMEKVGKRPVGPSIHCIH